MKKNTETKQNHAHSKKEYFHKFFKSIFLKIESQNAKPLVTSERYTLIQINEYHWKSHRVKDAEKCITRLMHMEA